MEITYRKLQPQEAAVYRKIRLESLLKYPESFCSNYQSQLAKGKLSFEEYIETQNPYKFIIGAFDVSQIIGICGFNKANCNKTGHRGEIIQMYVKEGYQGQHVGINLINTTLEKAFAIEELEHVELGVLSTSPAASRLYKKAGFEEFGFQKNYFKAENEYVDQKLMFISKEKFQQEN